MVPCENKPISGNRFYIIVLFGDSFKFTGVPVMNFTIQVKQTKNLNLGEKKFQFEISIGEKQALILKHAFKGEIPTQVATGSNPAWALDLSLYNVLCCLVTFWI